MNISNYMKQHQALIEGALKDCLHPVGTRPAVLHEAMHYCVLSGGKRIRPILCIAAAEAFGVEANHTLLPAVAIELYHCSTLVHDDLPCMDDDDLRRGRPTCHIKYGAANAVLAGDALMIHAFQLLAEFGNSALSLELAKSAGCMGVIAGQTEDLAAENEAPSAELVEYIHFYKTAVLMRAAVRMGALIGGADDSELDCISRYGEQTGLAFQIADDILDQTSSDEILGKPAGSDLKKHKLTYPSVHGMDAAKARVKELTREANGALDPLSRNTDALRAIADHLENRQF